MEYSKLGRNGLKVSRLSLGSWVTFSNQIDVDKAQECMAVAFDHGVNFFDNAEVYAAGKSEEFMGQILKRLKWNRLKYIVSTKFFWGFELGPNQAQTLNRKYLMHSIDGSLRRLQMEYVDIVYCHRPDPETPIEETAWAMHDMISAGKALYWGTSEWSAEAIEKAFEVCERYNLRKPVVEQPQYNLIVRGRVEDEYAHLYEKTGIGLTTWSPLASGILSGKYLNGVPEGTRLARPTMAWLKDECLKPEKTNRVRQFIGIAKNVDSTPAQLAIAWCLRNKNVSSVITGATSPDQVRENMKAIDVLKRVDESIWKRIDEL